MAWQCDVTDWDAVKTVCPLQCRLRYGATSHNPTGDPANDQVDWAGLPTNLDLAFSREQRDKVYAQHLMRKRAAQLQRWLRGGPQLCVCAIAAQDGTFAAGAGEFVSGR